MKKYLNYFIVVFITVIVSMMFSSYDKVDETKEIEASSYNIERVHYDMMFEIFRVRTPQGTYMVMWEETKGGLCVLK